MQFIKVHLEIRRQLHHCLQMHVRDEDLALLVFFRVVLGEYDSRLQRY